ncbi:hypothetical protein [Natronoglycomyces albus]|uniref:Transposase n=1 Tax=Natronoglycomyces albus TaxID=2811108 RepID=A0A895XLH9_9ACTN|nr:hypothetical protein [Natronoglycomyces albus]QSB06194.1 hypothetical protein JQS30_04590 [Natronoglycomyces albus]
MAKALYGHVGHAPSKRLIDEVVQLRARVRSLESELAQLQAHETQVETEKPEELLRLSEPALT